MTQRKYERRTTNTPDGCKGGCTCGASHAPRRGEPQMGLGRINDPSSLLRSYAEAGEQKFSALSRVLFVIRTFALTFLCVRC